MTLLCFLLDLGSIPPPLLRDLKQCLLKLANLYAVSCGRRERERGTEEIPLLRDRIGLCYLHKSRSPSLPPELKIAYKPGGNFCLRDFHHAVNNLPTDSFLLESSESMPASGGNQEVLLANLLSMEALYAWGGEDVLKKVIAVGTSVFTNSEVLQKSLMDAAERCVTVEFVVLEQEAANLYHDVSEKIKRFVNSISDLENCVLRRYLPGTWVLCGLVKRWLEELRNDIEEPVQAVFLFKNTVLGTTNHISCSLFASSNQIVDGFTSCQTCRCHGYPINTTINMKAKRSCPLTCKELGSLDLIQNAVRVGEQTVLFLPSFDGLPELRRISAPIKFNVIERTNLASLNEGVIVGTSYVATPSACQEMETASDQLDKLELNTQLFHGLCGALFELDQGLVCSSTCNTETMRDGTFQCFYILQPSDRGPMLLRRLAGSEEILPIPDMSRSNDFAMPGDIRNSIQASLSKIELRDYNPLQHERGFHPKLNWLIKESLQFGSIPLRAGTNPKLQNPAHHQPSILEQPSATQIPEEESFPDYENKDEEKTYSCVTEEWEQLLIIDEMKDSYSPTSISKPKLQNSTSTSKPLDEKTSRILERLEPPKHQKQKAASPSVSSHVIGGQTKKPLVPFDSSSSQASQLLKPNFQGLKRRKR